MYEKARRGESIELSPRRISIFHFDIERSLEDRFIIFFYFKLLEIVYRNTNFSPRILSVFSLYTLFTFLVQGVYCTT